MRSRWSAISAEVPDYSNDPDAFVDGVLEVLDRYPARMLLPAHDGSIQALRSRRAEIEQRVALPLASEAALDIAVRKAKTLALAAELGIPTPRSVHVHDLDEVPAALATVGLPAVIKPEQSWVERDGVGMRLSSEAVQSTDQAKRSLESVFAAGGHALMQQWLPGRREAVSLFYVQDRFWARMAQVSHREWPVLGGVSVMCETIPLLADITEFSERLVRAVALEGNSMVEFRRDQAGIPVLMEVNPRMGGSLALALSAGVNLPRLTYDWMLGNRLTPFAGYRVGKRLRWLVGDIWNLKCVYETQGHPDSPRRLNATASFVSDFFRPANTLDGIDVHDLRPAISEMNKIVFRHAVGRVQRILPSIGAHRRGE